MYILTFTVFLGTSFFSSLAHFACALYYVFLMWSHIVLSSTLLSLFSREKSIMLTQHMVPLIF